LVGRKGRKTGELPSLLIPDVGWFASGNSEVFLKYLIIPNPFKRTWKKMDCEARGKHEKKIFSWK
jgi:hypothetical protein